MKLLAELRDLCHDRLAAAIPLIGGGGNLPVYDHVPASPALPYAVLAEHSWEADDTDTSHGGDFVLYVDIHSKYRGSKEASQYASAIRERLHHQESQLSPVGFVLLTIEVTDLSGELLDDATTRRARLGVLFKVDDITTQSY